MLELLVVKVKVVVVVWVTDVVDVKVEEPVIGKKYSVIEAFVAHNSIPSRPGKPAHSVKNTL
jgi:hypothetical protein